MNDTPHLSLMVICGDAGVATLGRMLKSVLDRPDGALCDEIVIGWNGTDDAALRDQINPLLESPVLVPNSWVALRGSGICPRGRIDNPVDFTIIRFEWRNDFAYARNLTMSHCRGEWILWLDSVTGETPVVVRRTGSTFFEYVEIRDLIPDCYRGKKTVNRYERSDYEVLTHDGWRRLEYVYQHRVAKPVYRVVDDHGDVRVTEDHSLFSGGKEICGRDIRKGTRLDHIDLTQRLGESVPTISSELAEVWGFFAAEGSALVYEEPAKRYFMSLANTNKELLLKYKPILEAAHTRPFKMVEDRSKGGESIVWKLCASEAKDLAEFYRERFYSSAGRKKVPKEILNGTPAIQQAFLCGYELGDGYVRRVAQDGRGLQSMSTDSPLLAAGLHYLYRINGRDFFCNSPRPDAPHIVSMVERAGGRRSRFTNDDLKKMHQMRDSGALLKEIAAEFESDVSYVSHILSGAQTPRPMDGTDSGGRRTEGVRHVVPDHGFEDWVYDLSTEAHTFVGGIGDFVLHNTDDIVSSSRDLDSLDGLKAINAKERKLGLPVTPASTGSGTTLKDWLKQLPWNITCVRAPYDYLIDAHGNAVIDQVRRRVLRRDCYVWRLPIHELAYPKPGIVEMAADTAGLLVRHYMAQDSAEKLQRNAGVLTAMQERKGTPYDTSQPVDYADARHAYDVACMHIGLGDLAQADSAIRTAIQRSGDAMDTYRYRLTRAQINITRGIYETAYAEAVAATGLRPEMQDGWMVAAECQSLQGKWQSCIDFYRMGAEKRPCPQPVDFVQAREIKPRAQVAIAYCELGEPAKGLAFAEEAAKLYPHDAMASQTLERVHHDLDKRKALDGLLDAVAVLVSKRELLPAQAMLDAADAAVPMRGIRWIPRYQELCAAVRAGLAHFKRDMHEGDAPTADDVARLGPSPEGSRLVYYRHEVGPVDEEAVVRHFLPLGYQVLQVAKLEHGLAARVRKTAKPHLAFYTPHAISQWDPRFPEQYGIGGSESAVVYLAKELSRRGYPITIYCPTGAHLDCDLGFVWRSLRAFDASADHGILVACRAPWILRNPDVQSPTFIWHQDNGYGSTWHWNPEIDRRSAGSLHVSTWARAGLLRELYGDDGERATRHHVIGNGVLEEWCLASRIEREPSKLPQRHPHRVVYASDPTRGLDTLLNCWPHVLEAVPDAELHVYGDLMTSHLLLAGVLATARELNFLQMRQKLSQTKNVVYKGRVGQHALTQAMLEASVYAYPGGPMPEGYGIALAQAAAAGCAVVFPNEGALPDLHDQRYMVPPVKSEDAARQFLDALIRALREMGVGDATTEEGQAAAAHRFEISRRIRSEHIWSKVADRFEAALAQASLVVPRAVTDEGKLDFQAAGAPPIAPSPPAAEAVLGVLGTP